jgi:hypothetical protein
VYVAAPFVYLGTTYVPLRSVTSLIGAALLWNSLEGRAVVTYNGREFGLLIGSPAVVLGGEEVVLHAAPILVSSQVYVPVEFCEQYLEVPVEHSRTTLRLRGREGWHEYRIAARPPGRVSRAMVRPGRKAGRVERVQGLGGERKAGGHAKKALPGHGYEVGAAGRGKVKHIGGGRGEKKPREVKRAGGGRGREKQAKRNAEGGGGKGHGGKGRGRGHE